jgi:drug/metabolite transporter (DMT)-like permease
MVKRRNKFYLGMLLIGILLTVPEGTMIRIASYDLSASVMTMLRYVAAAIFALPFVIAAIRKHQITIKRLLFLMLIAVPLVFEPLLWQYVIATTNASFASILNLSGPMVFMIISTFVTKDRISRNQIIGFLLAVLGGMVIVLLPNLNGGAELNFGVIPVILMFIHIILASIVIVLWRKESERGTPVAATIGSFYFAWAIVSTVMVILSGDMDQIQNITMSNWLIIVYLGAITSIMFNVVFTKYYAHVGTTAAATMKYLKRLLSVLVPIIVLGEVLSWEIALGAVLIIVGTIFAQKKLKHKK